MTKHYAQPNLRASFAALGVLAMCAIASTPAVASDGDSATGSSSDIANTSSIPLIPGGDAPKGADVQATLPEEYASSMPAEATLKLTSIPGIDSATWRDGVLTLYTASSRSALVGLAEKKLTDVKVRVLPAAHSRAEIDRALESIVFDPNLVRSGAYVVTAVPSDDLSSIDVQVTGGPASLYAEVTSWDGIPVTFSETEEVSLNTRVRTTAPVYGGQYMTDGTWACTNAFWVVNTTTSVRSNLSAEHCATAAGQTWYYGGNPNPARVLGVSQGQAAGASDLELYSDPAFVNGTGWVLTGAYNNNTSISPIRGAVAPVVGNSVCYSGSRSGLVCQNVIDSVGLPACYAPTQCYLGMVFTTQVNGVPASGDGDSGGPVIAVQPGGHVYAVGVTSGGQFPLLSTCTGDPGGTGANDRKCSVGNIFAPLAMFFSNNSPYGLYYVPF